MYLPLFVVVVVNFFFFFGGGFCVGLCFGVHCLVSFLAFVIILTRERERKRERERERERAVCFALVVFLMSCYY